MPRRQERFFRTRSRKTSPPENNERRSSVCVRERERDSLSTNTMPPRLPMLLSARLSQWSSLTYSPLSFLLPQFRQQARDAHILATLSDTPGAYNKRIRRGRGPASGKGKTSGRGHKGQKQHGKVPARFNGGQTLDIVVHGERGFKNMYV
jgi:large subunit ribosomal protein L15